MSQWHRKARRPRCCYRPPPPPRPQPVKIQRLALSVQYKPFENSRSSSPPWLLTPHPSGTRTFALPPSSLLLTVGWQMLPSPGFSTGVIPTTPWVPFGTDPVIAPGATSSLTPPTSFPPPPPLPPPPPPPPPPPALSPVSSRISHCLPIS